MSEIEKDQVVDAKMPLRYEPPQLLELDVSEIESGMAGAFEATFGVNPIFQVS